jgi:hypothetical protein
MHYRRTAPLVLALLLSAVSVSFGELPREPREKADYVVTGTVDGVFSRDEGYYHYYIVALRVDAVEKGKLEQRSTFYVSCFRRKASAPKEPSATGHELPPKEGTRIKAYVKDGKGKHPGIYSDWYDELKPADSE